MGRTPLQLASKYGHLEIVKYLISNGADVSVNIKDNWGLTPLHEASQNGHLEVVEYLISKGADVSVDSKNNYGNTPLHYASKYKNLEIVKYLIFKGADINIQNICDSTPLHIASENGYLDIVKYLITLGSDLKLETEETVSKIKKLLEQIKDKIYRMYIFTQILNQKYLGISIFVISKILKFIFDHKNLFSNEELMAISTFGTQNREIVILDTDDTKVKYLYLPLYEEYPFLFGYLNDRINM